MLSDYPLVRKCFDQSLMQRLPYIVGLVGSLLFLMGLELRGRAAERWVVETWRTENGLPQNSVMSIVQTREGYLWLGTLDGLTRFDGVRMVTFGDEANSGLESARVQMLSTGDGLGVWIATDGGGVSWTSAETGDFLHFGVKEGLADARVTALAVDGDGVVWVVTSNGQLQHLVNGRFVSVNISRAIEGGPGTLSVDGRGRLWVASRGFCGVMHREGRWQIVLEQGEQQMLAGGGAPNRHWLLAGSELREINLDTLAAQRVDQLESQLGVTTILEDRSGGLWLGTSGSGLLRRAPGQVGWQTIGLAEGLTHPHVQALREDSEGNLWAGTQSGLCRLKPEVFRVLRTRDGLSDDVVQSVSEAPDGTIWFGTSRGGLNAWRNGAVQVFRAGDGLARDAVWAVYAVREDDVWVGTWGGGLQRLRQGQWQTYGPEQGMTARIIRAITRDRQGRLWVGSQDAGAFVRENGRFRQWGMKEGLSIQDVRVIHEDREGRVWLGTSFGLNVIERGRVRLIGRRDGLESDFIRALHESEDGTLWVGTGGGGLARVRAGRIDSITVQQGLPDNFISQIVPDELGYLWVGCNSGIFRVSETNLNAVADGREPLLSYISYNDSDGIARSSGGFQPSSWKTRDGRLLFPLVAGLAEVTPAKLGDPQPAPRVHLEEVQVDDRVFRPEGTLRITSNFRAIQVRFTAFNYGAPRRLQFEHRLDPWDPAPLRTAEHRVATYPRLKPGTYEFRVTAANKDGVRSVVGAGFRLIVVPMIWETLWFRLLLAAVLSLTVVLVVRGIFTRRIRRRLRLLEQQNALQQERARIAKDMHDDIGARLTQIGILTEVFARGKAPQTAELPSRINSLTRDVVQALDEIVWAVNPRNDSLEPLVRYLLNYAEEYLTGCAISCRTNTPGRFPDRPVPSDTRHNLYLAVKETLNNIVKHAGATEVRIDVNFANDHLLLSLHDNGRGLPAEAQRASGEGLENLRRRLESVGGHADIANAPEGGCRVRFVLPLPPE